MTSSDDRINQIEVLLAATVQITRSNAMTTTSNSAAIAANRADIAATNEAIASTQAQVNGLVQTITEFSIKTEARLDKLDEAITDIRTTNVRLELILRQLTQRNDGNNPEL